MGGVTSHNRPQCLALLSASGAVWRRGSFHGSRAGNREQLAGVHALVDAQLAPVLQHAESYPGDVARVVQPGVRATFVLQTQLLQHGAQLRLRAGHLEEEEKTVAVQRRQTFFTADILTL